MNLAVLVYLCVGIIPLVPNLIGGREMNERQDYRVSSNSGCRKVENLDSSLFNIF